MNSSSREHRYRFGIDAPASSFRSERAVTKMHAPGEDFLQLIEHVTAF